LSTAKFKDILNHGKLLQVEDFQYGGFGLELWPWPSVLVIFNKALDKIPVIELRPTRRHCNMWSHSVTCHVPTLSQCACAPP